MPWEARLSVDSAVAKAIAAAIFITRVSVSRGKVARGLNLGSIDSPFIIVHGTVELMADTVPPQLIFRGIKDVDCATLGWLPTKLAYSFIITRSLS